MNHILKAVTRKLPVVLFASLLSSTVAAQGAGSVVESQPFTPGQSRSANSAPSNSNNDALSLLLDQIRDLQSEVQSLRAMVEEQSFELRKMQRDSLSRYTNVDDRLSGLESGAAASACLASLLALPMLAIRLAAPPVASNTPALNQRPISSARTGSSPTAQPPASAAPRPPATRNIGRGYSRASHPQ